MPPATGTRCRGRAAADGPSAPATSRRARDAARSRSSAPPSGAIAEAILSGHDRPDALVAADRPAARRRARRGHRARAAWPRRERLRPLPAGGGARRPRVARPRPRTRAPPAHGARRAHARRGRMNGSPSAARGCRSRSRRCYPAARPPTPPPAHRSPLRVGPVRRVACPAVTRAPAEERRLRKVLAVVLAVPVVAFVYLATAAHRTIAGRALVALVAGGHDRPRCRRAGPPAPDHRHATHARSSRCPRPHSTTRSRSGVALRAPVTIQFSKPMDAASVVGALRVEPLHGRPADLGPVGRALTVAPWNAGRRARCTP